MRKTGYHKQDWFIALAVGLVFAGAIFTRNAWLERLELAAYDIGVRVTHRLPGASDQIAVVAIDDQSIAETGRWPWPRSALTGVLERLAKAEARAVAVLLDLTEPQVDRGLTALRAIREQLRTIAVPKEARPPFDELRQLLDQADDELDADRLLARALSKTPRPHLPMYVVVGEPRDRAQAPMAAHLQRHRLTQVIADPNDAGVPPAIATLRAPLEPFARHAAGVGHLSFRADPDRGLRALHTVLEHDGHYYPALPLLLAASALGLDVRQMELATGKGVKLGKLFVPNDRAARTYTGFYQPPAGGEHAFAVYSFRDVQADRLPPSVFTNKIVLLGLTATGAGASFVTPVTPAGGMSEPELAANLVASILNQDFYIAPDWTVWAEAGMVLVLVLYLMLVLPRLRGGSAALVSLLLLLGLLGAAQFLMVTEKLWLRTAAPALLLFAGHLAIALKRFVTGERENLAAQADSVHTNRMLGLTFQSQGQLDMAMDKFRMLPVNASVLDLIYNLALDFERKRQFHKAAAAYDYILQHDSGFRDCAERKKRASQGETIMLGATVLLDGAEKPTLGRYLIEKELGRGAMGIVYLGLDPKINRRVAIKTMALSQEFEAKELAGVRERFFREAETAGRLHHPHIVTIYDVGEDHDLAYIAMEYLEGKGLDTYIEPGKRLPVHWILDVAVKVADALAYAHRHDVVHRDIKPNNIIYHDASGGVKVMDFGIARITAASRTKTGLVLGTPAYMSPEQIAGKRVDGRSDLYSFGAMLFEMLTGDTPFDGDSFAALMHQITHAPAPDVRKLRPDTPPRLAAIIKRLLQKPVTKRYQSGDELKRDLEQCREGLTQAAKA